MPSTTAMIYISSFILVVLTSSHVSSFNISPHHGIVSPPQKSTKNLNSNNIKLNTKLCMSIPSAVDTATSGFASIARLPFGTIVSSPAGEQEKQQYRIKALYDIEQSIDCREVRERVTELDLVVETLIPAASNSRAFNDEKYEYFCKESSSIKAGVPVMVVADDKNEEEKTLIGLDNIMNFFDEVYGPRGPIVDDVDELKSSAAGFLIATGAYIPPIMRIGRGETVAGCALSPTTPRPKKPLILYSYEGNQFCRLVREVLTELDLPYELRSAGKGSTRRAELAQITGGSTQCPFLIDPNSNAEMGESKDIIQYLYKTYALYTPPSELLGNVSNVITPVLKPIFKTLAPLQAGSNSDNKSEYDSDIASAKAEIEKEIKSETVVIYTYSLSPFCTEAVGVLQNLGGVQFKEISLGAEWLPFLINEGGAQKRVALAEMTGQSSLPHVFVNGESIGGLYEGLLPALEDGRFFSVMQKSTDSTEISGEEVEN